MANELDAAERAAGIGLPRSAPTPTEVVDFAYDLLPSILFLIWFRERMTSNSRNTPTPSQFTARMANRINLVMDLIQSIDWLGQALHVPAAVVVNGEPLVLANSLSREQLEAFALGALERHFRCAARELRRSWRARPCNYRHDFRLRGYASVIPPRSVALAVEHLVPEAWRERFRPRVTLDALAGKEV